MLFPHTRTRTRAQTSVRASVRFRRTATTIGGSLLALSLLAACGEEEPTGADDPATTAAGEESSPSEPGSGTTSEETSEPPASDETSASDTPAETVSVPVYFVGDTPQGPRLFGELREVPADNPLEEAMALVTAGDTLDPDYRTLYPGGSFGSIEHDGGSFLVSVRDDGWRQPVGQTRQEARLAVQQLVYTLQAVQGTKDPVLVSMGDTEEKTLFGVDVAGGVRAAPQPKVAALVNVTSPAEGASVSGTFTAEGLANSFEATVPWQIRDSSGKVVLDGFSTAEGWGVKLYPWTAEVDVSSLEPGQYSFVAMTDDPSGGEGGGPQEDSKTVVVE